MKTRYIKICSIFLVVIMTICSLPINAFSIESTNDESQRNILGEVGGYLAGTLKTTEQLYTDRKFNNLNGGHGFAAENGNNLYDSLKGIDTKVIGNNNSKNGADRIVFNKNGTEIFIQDKYYASANKSVYAAFDTGGFYKYVDGDGMPMQLEVPADQYDDAVLKMKEYIEKGKVRNINDTAEAENIIRRGKLTYKQAVNLTKAGNIDSLKYDAATGVVSTSIATGISFAINFSLAIINGEDFNKAFTDSLQDSLKTGAVIGITHILASQLAKTSLNNLYVPVGEAISKVLGNDICTILLENAGVSTAWNVTSKAANLIAKEIHVQTVLLIVLSVPDIIDLFRGWISPEQLLANVTVAASGLAGASIGAAGGAAIGSLFPGPGTTIGGVIGSILGGTGAAIGSKMLIDNFTESDAEKMYNIIQNEFEKLSNDYIISRDEADKVVENLQKRLDGNTIKEMYSAEDRNKFADDLITELIEEQISKRQINIPSDDESRRLSKELLNDVIFIH